MACCDRSGPALSKGCLSGSLQRGPQRLPELFSVSFGPFEFLFDVLCLWCIICWAAECLAQCHAVGLFFFLSLAFLGCSSGAERSAKVKLLL